MFELTEEPSLVLSIDYRQKSFFIFDFTQHQCDYSDVTEFTRYVRQSLANHNVEFGIGVYAENRVIYDHSDLFVGDVRRTVHLGIDLFCRVGTTVFTPYAAKVHSFANNANVGDYGPVVILEHCVGGVNFFTLYGHLQSVEHLSVGQFFEKGACIGEIGSGILNGGWPPHLHFQIIRNIGEWRGDYPGACKVTEQEEWLENCPNPNCILQIPGLNI